MTPISKYLQIGLIAVLLFILASKPSEGKIFKWHESSANRQDLLLLGFGELTMQVLDVNGNKEEFERSNPTLKADFSTNYRMSLFANGNITNGFLLNGAAIVDSRIDDEYQTVDPSAFRLKMSVESKEPIWDGWRFTGRGLYDPNRQWELENLDTRLLTQPQEPARLELLMRLASKEHGVIEGGSIRPSFKGSKFTLHQRSLFGAYADLHTGRVGVEAVGGKLEGKAFREGDVVGIRADGTSGPFDLTHTPITRGSEEVKIQTRDRFDESTVLSTETLVRDIDYTIDYLLGRVLLYRPVASETASSDPIFIVITYDYLRDENDEIYGGRALVTPLDDVQISGSYLHRNLDAGAVGVGVEEPEDLIAGDLNFKVDDHTSGYVEVAGAKNPVFDDDNVAIRAGVKTEIIKNLKLKADFQKIDDQYRSFTNSDLNPIKNQRRTHLGGNYQITDQQTVMASFVNLRVLEENGQFNTYNGLRDEKIYKLGYRNDLAEKFKFGLKFERRNVKDAKNSINENNHQNRAMADLSGRFNDVFLLGQLNYDANYELIMFRNDANIGDNDANTNQLALTLTSKPSEQAHIKIAQRFSLRSDRVLDIYSERQDATFITAQYKPRENLNTLTTYEYKRYTAPGQSVNFWQDNPFQTQWAGTFALEYLPLTNIKTIGKAGRHESRKWLTDTTHITKDFILGQVTYFNSHHLSYNVETEYSLTDAKDNGLRRKIWDIGISMNWNKDRLNEFTVGLIRRLQEMDEITSSKFLFLINGSVSITKRFFARGSVKEIMLDEPLNNGRTFTKLEVGFDSHGWYRVSLGYQRIDSENDPNPDLNYTGQGLFVRFTGKL